MNLNWNSKKWLIIGSAAGGLILLAIVISFFTISGSDRISEPAATSPTVALQHEQLWKDSETWHSLPQKTAATPGDPLLIQRSDQILLYLHQGILRYVNRDGDNQGLISVPEDRELFSWFNDHHLLLSYSIENQQYQWHYIEFAADKEPATYKFQQPGLKPSEIDTIKEAGVLGAFLITIPKSSEGLPYGLLQPKKNIITYVATVPPMVSIKKDIENTAPSNQRILPPTNGKTITVSKSDIHILNEPDGVYLFHKEGSDQLMGYRYEGLSHTEVVTIPQEGNEVLSVLLFSSPEGPAFMRYISGGNLFGGASLYPWNELLRESGWIAYTPVWLYRIKDQELETIGFRFHDRSQEVISSYHKMQLTDGAKLTKEGSMFEQLGPNQQVSSFSLYDLFQFQPATADSLQVNDLLIRKKLQGTDFPTEDKTFYPTFIERKLPVKKLLQDPWPTNIPQELRDELIRQQNEGSGDAMGEITFSNHKGTWYFLQLGQLYQFDPGKAPTHRLILLGTMPVSTHSIVTNYSITLTAKSFIRHNESWFAADTYGDRIIQMDNQLKVMKEVKVQMPTDITLINNGTQLQVNMLTGTHVYDVDSLQLIRQKEAGFSNPEAYGITMEDVHVTDQTHWEDKTTGFHWYHYAGLLYIWDAKQNQIRPYHIGYMKNGNGQVHIRPWTDNQILVFTDEHAYLFQSSDGRFLRSIAFPRESPDGIYDSSPRGENSFILNNKQGTLYLVQGYRILEINLNTRVVKERFRQNAADLGKLLKHGNSLLFSLHAGGRFMDFKDAEQELIQLDLKTNNIHRYQIPKSYHTDRLEGDQIILWCYEQDGMQTAVKMLQIPISDLAP